MIRGSLCLPLDSICMHTCIPKPIYIKRIQKLTSFTEWLAHARLTRNRAWMAWGRGEEEPDCFSELSWCYVHTLLSLKT